MFPFNFHTLRKTVVVIFKTLKPAKTFGASGYRVITVPKYGWNLKRSSSNFSEHSKYNTALCYLNILDRYVIHIHLNTRIL